MHYSDEVLSDQLLEGGHFTWSLRESWGRSEGVGVPGGDGEGVEAFGEKPSSRIVLIFAVRGRVGGGFDWIGL